MKIEIDNFLSEAEKKEIVIAAYRESVMSAIIGEKEITRVLSNAAYNSVYKIVDECFDVESKRIIKEKIDEILSCSSSYHIFKKPDIWCAESNKPYDFLQLCITENYGVIEEKVSELIDEQTIKIAKLDIKESIREVILKRVEEI